MVDETTDTSAERSATAAAISAESAAASAARSDNAVDSAAASAEAAAQHVEVVAEHIAEVQAVSADIAQTAIEKAAAEIVEDLEKENTWLNQRLTAQDQELSLMKAMMESQSLLMNRSAEMMGSVQSNLSQFLEAQTTPAAKVNGEEAAQKVPETANQQSKPNKRHLI